MLDEIHAEVEKEIAEGAPAVNPAITVRKVRRAFVDAGGDPDRSFDKLIRELDDKFYASLIPSRPLGEEELSVDKPLGRVVNALRECGGGIDKSELIAGFGENVVKEALDDPSVFEDCGKLYLWCHCDFEKRPLRDYRQAIDALVSVDLDKAESAYAACVPFDEARLHEVSATYDETSRQLDDTGFFAFGRKKELRSRMNALSAERKGLEEAKAALQAVEDVKARIAKLREEAERELEARDLLK